MPVQFSLFGAEVAPPTLADLDGLVIAGGDFARAGHGRTVRLSVLVADPWRADALAAEFAARGLPPETPNARPAPDAPAVPRDGLVVRTGFDDSVAPVADRWTRGASLRAPDDLELTAPGLRLWLIARGRANDAGYLIGCRDADDPLNRIGGSQLARLGVAAVQVGVRGGPGWRVSSVKRLRRLAELVGSAPDGAGRDWPDV